MEKATLVLSLLVEGSSIRSAERVTGVHRDTIGRLLMQVGTKCEALLEGLVRGVEAKHVQADELWSVVGMREKRKRRLKITDPKVGDAYTFIALDSETKLTLAWHLGRRTHAHADAFVEKLANATTGRFQLSTDGFQSYPDAVGYHLGDRTDYATIVKDYASEGPEALRRYAPPRLISAEKNAIHGAPDEARICTSHVERMNLSVRTFNKRFARLTLGYSKKWECLRAQLGLFFAHYNLCRIHSSIRMTPAIKAGLTNRPWSLAELLAA